MSGFSPAEHGIRAGDASAFADWLRDAEPRVRASLGRFAGAVDTEAVLQETLLRVWQVAPRIEPDGRPEVLVRLAVRIARNLAVDHTRRARTEPVATEPEEAEDVVGPATPDPLLRRLVVLCLERLPARPRLALMQRLDAAGARHDDALAAALGMTLNTFLKNVGRARALMTDCLRGRGVDLAEELR